MTALLIAIALVFAELSLLAFGGGNTVLPEMRRQAVEVQHWITDRQFTSLFALAQAAPGPNMMVVPLIGWHVAGLAGLLVASLAKFGPSSMICGAVYHVWERFKDRPLRRTIQAGLIPVTAGLIAASAVVIAEATTHSWLHAVIIGAVAAAATMTRIHPLLLLAAGALLGATGLGQS